MALSDEKLRGYVQRLLLSRMRILSKHGFFGLLLMHMRYSVDEVTETAYTDGSKINFGAEFLDSLSDVELDFVMMHEIMHVVLQHCYRGSELDDDLFNVACDIVVNSNLLLENDMLTSRITLAEYGEAMHLTPEGKEGYDYTAEQVYRFLLDAGMKPSGNDRGGLEVESGINVDGGVTVDGDGKSDGAGNGQWDNHSHWGDTENAELDRDVWTERIKSAAQAISVRDPSNSRGDLPLFAQRMLEEMGKPQTDWRTVLNEFVQEEVVDYSFSPPDRRFGDTEFFLPDFNEKDDRIEDILFMIDTSGSMSDAMITAAYAEIKGAIEQFDGKLKGWLSFFDAQATKPQAFATVDELCIIRPQGGGGTRFEAVFECVKEHMDTPPASIIILTDGDASFPNESMAMGIPVLWLINNRYVAPPWGKVARISVP